MAVPLQRSTAVTSSHASQSQMTASVLEFRCMFSHDVHKKQKKWHDGTLKFHAFNRRVMVYDETRNFVGDLHYRLAEEFGEGLELRLERPVLVQVEEQLGQSKTDLTPLLNRSKPDGGADAAVSQPSRATLSRINAANPQVKPKSIRELLGTSQGRIGRARIPVHSPYEQRVALAEIQPAEPPTKRRRLSHEEQRHDEKSAAPLPVANQQAPGPGAAIRRPLEVDNVAELSSDDSVVKPVVQNSKRDRQSKIFAQSNVSSAHIISEPTKTTPNPRQKDEPSKRKQKTVKSAKCRPEQSCSLRGAATTQPEANAGRAQPATPHISSSSGTPNETSKVVSSAKANRPRSSLKFASQPPRPKLMYRALLVDASNAVTGTADSTASQSSVRPTPPSPETGDSFVHPSSLEAAAADEPFSASPGMNTANVVKDLYISDLSPATPLHNLNQSRMETALSVGDQGIGEILPDSVVHDSVDNAMVTDSPLFMPRTVSQLSPLPATQFTLDDLIVPQMSQIIQPNGSQSHTSKGQSCEIGPLQVSQEDTACNDAAASPDQSSAPEISDMNTTESLGDHQKASVLASDLLEKSVLRPTSFKVPSSRSHTFRRIVSETLPFTGMQEDDFGDGFDDNKSEEVVSREFLQTSNENCDVRKAGTLHTLLQPRQATSDSALLEAMAADQAAVEADSNSEKVTHAQNTVAIDEELEVRNVQNLAEPNGIANDVVAENTNTGAWTSTEAFLLFDWWPPGKEKPDYGQQEETVGATTIRTTGVGNLTRSRLLQNAQAMTSKKYGTFGSAKLVSQRS